MFLLLLFLALTHGSNCATYCTLFQESCADTHLYDIYQSDTTTCLRECKSFTPTGLACRMSQIESNNCESASPLGAPGCNQTSTPIVEDFCNVLLSGCRPLIPVSDPEVCLIMYAAMYNATTDDELYPTPMDPFPFRNDDGSATLSCRRFWASQARDRQAETNEACDRAMSGAGVCGSRCDTYCAVMDLICPAEYGTIESCLSVCSQIPDTGEAQPIHIEFMINQENSLQCRLAYATFAVSATNNNMYQGRDRVCNRAGFQSMNGGCRP